MQRIELKLLFKSQLKKVYFKLSKAILLAAASTSFLDVFYNPLVEDNFLSYRHPRSFNSKLT